MGGFRDRGWRRVGLGKCKVGGVGSRSNHTPWILCSAVRTISSIGANEVWFHVVTRAAAACTILSGLWLRSRDAIAWSGSYARVDIILNTFKTTQPQHDYDHYFVLLRVSY